MWNNTATVVQSLLSLPLALPHVHVSPEQWAITRIAEIRYIEEQTPLRESPQMFNHYEDLDDGEDDSQATASVFSDSSWPATPGLTRSLHSHTTSISSLMVTTPPLPAVSLPMDAGIAKHLPPSDPDDFFGPAWTRESLPVMSDQ